MGKRDHSAVLTDLDRVLMEDIFQKGKRLRSEEDEVRVKENGGGGGDHNAVPLSRFWRISEVYWSKARAIFLLKTLFLSLM